MANINRPTSAAWVWIAIAFIAIVALAVVLAVILTPPATTSGNPTHVPANSTSTAAPAETFDGEFVDPDAVELGLIPQPITDDPEAYMQAAILAGFTWDLSKGTFEQRTEHLARWVTAPGMFDDPDDELTSLRSGQEVFSRLDADAPRVDVVDATRNGMRQSAEIVYLEASSVDNPDGPPRLYWNYTVDVQRSWTDRVTGEEISIGFRFDGFVIVSCEQSQPPADSAQAPGDCMVWNVGADKVY